MSSMSMSMPTDMPMTMTTSTTMASSTTMPMGMNMSVPITNPWLQYAIADVMYARPTVEFICAAIGLATLFNIVFLLRTKRTGLLRSARPSLLDRIVGVGRYLNARQLHVKAMDWYSPTLSATLVMTGFFVFIMALTFAVRPYYWDLNHGWSQPIATRSGLISVGILPFMIVLGTKANFVGYLTGTSHEKLQVFHRWTAMIMYITSLIHTFPFIVKNFERGEATSEWYTDPCIWTGVAALVPQTWLVFCSWGFFRNPYYEFFKKMHLLAALLFMVFMYEHTFGAPRGLINSWDYIFATVGLYAASWFFRVLRTIYNSGLALTAHLSTSGSDNLLVLTVPVPARFKWQPGQHVFLRFLGLGFPHAWSSHPWTIASAPNSPENSNGERTLDVVMRVHGGITRVLAKRAAGKPSVPLTVWVDGPYGGVPGGLTHYDEVLLLAGGTGASFVVPLLAHLASSSKNSTQRVQFVISLRRKAEYAWMEDAVAHARASLGQRLVVRVHITGVHDELAGRMPSLDEADEKASVQAVLFTEGRPDLPALVREACDNGSGRIAAITCGPDALIYDVSRAVAGCQLAISSGRAMTSELFLHTESFSW